MKELSLFEISQVNGGDINLNNSAIILGSAAVGFFMGAIIGPLVVLFTAKNMPTNIQYYIGGAIAFSATGTLMGLAVGDTITNLID